MSIELMAEPITPEDLLSMSDEGDYELVNGELVERQMGAESTWIAGNLFGLITHFYQGRIPGHLIYHGLRLSMLRGRSGQSS